MAHAVSVSSYRSDHMSPPALVLAVLLHASVVLALWWMSQNRPHLPPAEEPIEITIEQPKPPEPPPPPPRQEAQPPPPPVELGLRPPAPIISDKPTQVPSAPQSKEPPAPPPPPLREAVPAPQAQPPPPTPSPSPAPSPSQLATPAEPSPPAQAHALAPPPIRPPPPAPQPQLPPSPLSMAPQRRPPAAAPAEPPSPHALVNPADVYNRARLTDNYLWQVARKLSGYRYQANVTAREGLTVVRIVIARDGRLLDVEIVRSSGVPEFDRGVLAGVRAGSPYAPLPPEIQGDRASFDLPLISVNRQ